VIFPEAPKLDPGRWRRGIKRLETRVVGSGVRRQDMPICCRAAGGDAGGDCGLSGRGRDLRGPLGIDDIISVGELWRNFRSTRSSRLAGAGAARRGAADGHPRGQVQWLYDWWKLIDGWISATARRFRGSDAIPSPQDDSV